uniref:Uncharacterized protein n=1 Tax=Anguilla anguilla TaxID=7936 RepID=A0A0E9WMZ0_ANGAN
MPLCSREALCFCHCFAHLCNLIDYKNKTKVWHKVNNRGNRLRLC